MGGWDAPARPSQARRGSSIAKVATCCLLPCAAPVARRSVTVRAQEAAAPAAAPAKKPEVGPKRGSFVSRGQGGACHGAVGSEAGAALN